MIVRNAIGCEVIGCEVIGCEVIVRDTIVRDTIVRDTIVRDVLVREVIVRNAILHAVIVRNTVIRKIQSSTTPILLSQFHVSETLPHRTPALHGCSTRPQPPYTPQFLDGRREKSSRML